MQEPLDILFILGFWMVVGAVLIAPVYAITEVLDRYREKFPGWVRQLTGYRTAGDLIPCPHCEHKTRLIEGQPEIADRRPLGATCPRCGWRIHQH